MPGGWGPGAWSRPSRPSRPSSRQPGISSSNNRQTGTNSQSGQNTQNKPAEVSTPKGMTAQQQFAQTMQQAGAVTYGGLSGQSLWDKSPVLYSERIKDDKGKDTARFDPTSERIGQVDLSQSIVSHPLGEDYYGLKPFYSTMDPGAYNTGNAAWNAREQALKEGKSEAEASEIARQVDNEIKTTLDMARKAETKEERDEIMSQVPGWFTGSTADEYGFQGGYLGQSASGRMYDIEDPTPDILSNQAYAGSGGGYGGGWGGYGGGGGAGGGGGYYGPQPGYKPEQMAGFYTPQANLQQAMVNVHATPTVFKKRGGIVSLLRLS